MKNPRENFSPSSGCCAVTGASGYVGAHVAQHLQSAGYRVLRLGRDRQRDDRHFELGACIAPSLLDGVEVLVHCAYDPRARTAAEDARLNVQGTLQLLHAAEQAGVGRVIFISTVSAFEGCQSFYGQGKYVVEQAVLAMGGVVLRPGVVYGDPDRGMMGALRRLARLPLLPVFDGGKQEFVFVHVDDLAHCVTDAVHWGPGSVREPVVVAHPAAISFAALLGLLAASQGRKLRTFSMPGRMASMLLRALERAGLRLRFRSDSLVSMLNLNPQLDFSPGQRLGLHVRSFTDYNAQLRTGP